MRRPAVQIPTGGGAGATAGHHSDCGSEIHRVGIVYSILTKTGKSPRRAHLHFTSNSALKMQRTMGLQLVLPLLLLPYSADAAAPMSNFVVMLADVRRQRARARAVVHMLLEIP